jgi:pyrroline-5-carboxylate reductase
MPNTPALVESGAAGLYANNQVTKSQRTLAESLLRAVGIAVWVDHETQIDIVTALSGSGPAYHFLVMEAMQSSAEKMGLPSEAARLLSLQTAFGSAKLALESDVSFKTLRERVTSKGGTTAAALDRFSKLKLQDIFADAMQAAADRSHELSQQIGKS